MKPPLYAVMGPTASGKTALAVTLAERLNAEIVSCDSAAVFDGLDVGTAKPTAEEQARVKHHLIDVIPPTQQWSAAEFAEAADSAIEGLWARGKTAILCGGTGLWMRALVKGIFRAPEIEPSLRASIRTELVERGALAMHERLRAVDPVSADRIASNDPQRIGRALEVYYQCGRPISDLQAEHGFAERRYTLIGVAPQWPRDVLRQRVAERTQRMYALGLLDEVQRCLQAGVPEDAPGLKIIGYRDAVAHLRGDLTREEAIQTTITSTRRYAKRQINWFNHEPDIEWVEPQMSVDAVWAQLRSRSQGL
ncbi:MAG: tRNA (adenosine(37)-N6)-dimethylallyltransferase MiaA [Myxococcota bacterium]